MSAGFPLITESTARPEGHVDFPIRTRFPNIAATEKRVVMRFLNSFYFVVVVALTAGLEACSDEAPAKSNTGSGGGSTTSGTTTSGSTTDGTSSTTSSTTGGTTVGTGGAGGSGSTDMPSPLPFVVDSLFVASGFMGDGETAGPITQDDNMTCMASRPPGSVGHCHKFTYTPSTKMWGGVYWQYPVGNWGATPGKRIAAGATKVTFYAAGAAGGESIKFIVGGMSGMANSDTVNANVSVVLTTTPMPYIVDLTGQTYDAVLGGFGWTAEAPAGSTAPISFTVDSIKWEQ
jgi:hypothetical protein